MTKKNTPKSDRVFEDSMIELEEIVDRLEKGELTLSESIDVFKKGIELSKSLNKTLDEIENKITILIENEDGALKEEKFKL